MTVSILVVIFFAFISYFAGRLLSHKVNVWKKTDRIIFIVFWAFLIGSIMLLLKWIQVNNAVGHTYYEIQGIKEAKANFMEFYFTGCFIYSVLIGFVFKLGLSQDQTSKA